MDIEIIRVNMNHKTTNDKPLSACIGYFDGLHIGHQKLVQQVISNSQERDLVPALITFDPDPIVVVRKFESIQHIMTLKDKIEYAKELGIKVIIILEIDDQMMRLSPHDFIVGILEPLNIKNIVCGFDFRFGFKGQGTAQTLQEYPELFDVNVIDEVDHHDMKISSTRIVGALQEGQVQEVKQLLGRPYIISGTIVSGNQKGRKIGFPTANLSVDPEYHLVKDGVYITEMKVGDRWYPAMTNVGHNLTFNTSLPISVETYILDFDQSIYNQEVKLAFHQYLRPELKFDKVEQLIEQMKQDMKDTQSYFDNQE